MEPQDELKVLTEQLANGELSADDYTRKLAELTDSAAEEGADTAMEQVRSAARRARAL